MPSLEFVLPHWLYWLGLLAFPLTAMYIIRQQGGREAVREVSLPIAYFLMLTGGFVGLHRFYYKNLLGLLFIPLFVGILYANVHGRDARDEVSRANNEVISAEFLFERANNALVQDDPVARKRVVDRRHELQQARAASDQARLEVDRWTAIARAMAIAILVLLLIDAFLLPGLHRRQREREAAVPIRDSGIDVACDLANIAVDVDGGHNVNYTRGIHNRFVDGVDKLNEFCGNFVAYWSILAVFVYYYEVVARYLFNSPTNWAHESMFLMFGMQYLLAGGYVMRNNGHVRVDVFYCRFSPRKKAMVDIATSVFFFIFALTLTWTGWTFFMDSFEVQEVSFTEWGIQYWPVKLALPLGAALLCLQGLAWLIKDVQLIISREET